MSQEFLENLKDGKCKKNGCDKISLIYEGTCKKHSTSEKEEKA